MKKYTDSHEWIEIEGEIGTVGITDHAQNELGDIVFVELPKSGVSIKAGDEVVVLESTKAAADMYSPVSGEIIEVNHSLNEASDLINRSAEKEGWIFRVRLTQLQELEGLLSQEQYQNQFEA